MKESSIHGIDSIDVDQSCWDISCWEGSRPGSKVVVTTCSTIFTTMGSHFLPSKEGMKTAWETMAHKAIPQTRKPTGKRASNSWKQLKWYSVRKSRPSFIILQCYVKKCWGNKVKFLRWKKRRPIAHTCGETLELPSTYSFYPEFWMLWKEQEISTCPKI